MAYSIFRHPELAAGISNRPCDRLAKEGSLSGLGQGEQLLELVDHHHDRTIDEC